MKFGVNKDIYYVEPVETVGSDETPTVVSKVSKTSTLQPTQGGDDDTMP